MGVVLPGALGSPQLALSLWRKHSRNLDAPHCPFLTDKKIMYAFNVKLSGRAFSPDNQSRQH